METKDSGVIPYAGAAIAGVVAGMRSMAAPALVSRLGVPSILPEAAGKVLPVLALGEALADKLPFMPSRTMPLGLAARAVSGGISGASITKSRDHSPLAGAVLGAAAAVGAAYAAHQLRKELGARLRLPDFVVALAEDALVVGVALRLLRTFGTRRG